MEGQSPWAAPSLRTFSRSRLPGTSPTSLQRAASRTQDGRGDHRSFHHAGGEKTQPTAGPGPRQQRRQHWPDHGPEPERARAREAAREKRTRASANSWGSSAGIRGHPMWYARAGRDHSRRAAPGMGEVGPGGTHRPAQQQVQKYNSSRMPRGRGLTIRPVSQKKTHKHYRERAGRPVSARASTQCKHGHDRPARDSHNVNPVRPDLPAVHRLQHARGHVG